MRKRIKAFIVVLFLLVVALVAAAIILKDDDCWPEPEPVPTDCKPGQPCPVDEPAGTTGGDVKPTTGVASGATSTSTSAAETGTTGLDGATSATMATASPVGGNG